MSTEQKGEDSKGNEKTQKGKAWLLNSLTIYSFYIRVIPKNAKVLRNETRYSGKKIHAAQYYPETTFIYPRALI